MSLVLRNVYEPRDVVSGVVMALSKIVQPSSNMSSLGCAI
jgi:hypothetical protein